MAQKINYNIGDKLGECVYMGQEYSVYTKSDGTRRIAKFKCRCGEIFEYRVDIIRKGRIKSCGCYYAESRKFISKTHGLSNSREYCIWENMIARCKQPKSTSYVKYGAIGIGVCNNWLHFSNFINDMGKAPSSTHTLDRINNHKGYCKENCRWATRKEQLENRRNTIYIEYNGEKKLLTEWAKSFNISYRKLLWRLKTANWPIEKAFDYRITVQ